MSTEAKEPGQLAYEAYHGVLRNQRWWHAEGSEDRKAWAAVERACAVPAATQGDGHNEDAAKYRELASAIEWNRRHRGTTLTIDGYLARARELGWDGTIEPTRPDELRHAKRLLSDVLNGLDGDNWQSEVEMLLNGSLAAEAGKAQAECSGAVVDTWALMGTLEKRLTNSQGQRSSIRTVLAALADLPDTVQRDLLLAITPKAAAGKAQAEWEHQQLALAIHRATAWGRVQQTEERFLADVDAVVSLLAAFERARALPPPPSAPEGA